VGFTRNTFSISNVTTERITVELEGILTDKQDIDSVLMKIAKNPAVVEVQRED
jgi:putative Mg2+ transporter-C (MgtC) family protein